MLIANLAEEGLQGICHLLSISKCSTFKLHGCVVSHMQVIATPFLSEHLVLAACFEVVM